MKKSLMNIKHFVDSNVRQRIDRAANNNSDFFDEDLIQIERQVEDIRQICIETEKRISTMLQSIQVTPTSLGAYTQNVQAGLNNLSHLTATGSLSNSHHNSNVSSSTTATSTLAQNSAHSIYFNSACNTSSINTNEHRYQDAQQLSQSILTTYKQQQQLQNSTSNNGASNSDTILTDPNELHDDIQKHKKLPIISFLKFLVKSRHKVRSDSLLGTTFTHCSQLQTQLTKLYLTHEQTIDAKCLKPIQHVLEVDIPNIVKLRKLFIKSHNDLESVRAKYNGASQKQLQSHQTNHSSSTSYTLTQNNTHLSTTTSKLDQLKNELDESVSKFDQARDTYAAELYAFVCRECELVNLFQQFYQYQAQYHHQVGRAIESSLPTLSNALESTRRKVVFGSPLAEHLRCTGRSISPVIELCIHLLHSNGLTEEGLFRIPGSSVKIKKLKNAINAWFVTIASQSELEVESQPPASSSCLLAIYTLFKDTLGQSPQQDTHDHQHYTTGEAPINHNRQSLSAISACGGGSANSLSSTSNNKESGDGSTLTSLNTQSTGSGEHQQQQQQQLSLPNWQNNQHQLVYYDLHSIAGLLKLYLRELPEHLFTYALYDQWINATVKSNNLEERLKSYDSLLGQLPRSNYENLRHLIRFLHLLTNHRGQNKMTATNLAITMAPSLIWAKPSQIDSVDQQAVYQDSTNSQVDCKNSRLPIDHHDETTAMMTCNTQQQVTPNNMTSANQQQASSLSMQMSNVGMSASLHALVIETLVSQAELLFPGEVQLSLPGFLEETPNLNRYQPQNCNASVRSSSSIGHFKRDFLSMSGSQRGVSGGSGGGNASRSETKSSSPTGLSTTSSSSFSSTSNASTGGGGGGNNRSFVNSSDVVICDASSSPNHRRGGSMEGLLSSKEDVQAPALPVQSPATNRVNLTRGRPVSVHIQSSIRSNQPPPVPPAPASRAHLRGGGLQSSVTASKSSAGKQQKPPAPPIPILSPLRRQQLAKTKEENSDVDGATFNGGTASILEIPSREAKINVMPTPSGSSLKYANSVNSSSTGGGSIRPTVPPPERPFKNLPLTTGQPVNSNLAHETARSPPRGSIEADSDSKSAHSITSSGNLRGELDEINLNDAEDISVSVSPIASLDSMSGDNSSFSGENDDGNEIIGSPESLDQSWTESCIILNSNDDNNTQKQQPSKTTATTNKLNVIENQGDGLETNRKLQNQASSSAINSKGRPHVADSDFAKLGVAEGLAATAPVPPVKPPRITSPKLTHSTPL